jgi:His/Glu/Gln/Arg/opine family amino acid ABC transporter permease subunit
MRMNIARVLTEAFPCLLQGIGVTAEITLLSLIIALVLGLVACLMSRSKILPVSLLAKGYVWLIRGTPLLVQVFFIYFGLPQVVQSMGVAFRLSPYAAGVITLSLNAGAYISEIFRGGILAVGPGQTEAARSLGLSKARTMARVVLPQALRVSIPSLVNQFIITLKDTSIISVISLAEVVYQAKLYIGRTMESFATWTVVGLMYLVVITVLSQISVHVEKRLDYARHHSR